MDDHGRTAPLPNAEISSLPIGMRIIDDDRRWKRKNNSSGISTNNISTRHRSKSALPDPPQRDAWFSSCIWLYLQAKWMVKYTCCKHPQAQVWVMLAGDFRFLSNKVSPKACWNKKNHLERFKETWDSWPHSWVPTDVHRKFDEQTESSFSTSRPANFSRPKIRGSLWLLFFILSSVIITFHFFPSLSSSVLKCKVWVLVSAPSGGWRLLPRWS